MPEKEPVPISSDHQMHDAASQATVIIDSQTKFFEDKEPARSAGAVDDVSPILEEKPAEVKEEPPVEEPAASVKEADKEMQPEVQQEEPEKGEAKTEEIKPEATSSEEPANSPPPLKQYSKRQPKPTQEYENFKNQQLMSKRSKKQGEGKKPQAKRSTEKVKASDPETSAPVAEEESLRNQRYSERFRSFN